MAVPRRSPERATVIYLLVAVAVRIADAGAGIGVVLLAADRLAPSSAGSVGGLLVACFSVPHLGGPVIARRLDRSTDPRRILAASYAFYAAALGAGVLTLGRLPLPAVAAFIALAGCCGPLLTSGLSSQLVGVSGTGDPRERRAQALDALTYGVAGTAGPCVVAALTSWFSPSAALWTLCGCALAAAVVCLGLQRPVAGQAQEQGLGLTQVLALLITDGRLRRVNTATVLTNLTQGGLAIVAVALALSYGIATSQAATLIVAVGVGNLLGSVVLSARPLRGDPDRLVACCTVAVAACLGLCAAAPSYGWALAAFGSLGVATAASITAVFAARTQYAPPADRAQVFAAMAGLKIAAGSLGAALAGALVGQQPRLYLLAMTAVVGVTVLAMVVDRRVGRARYRTNPPEAEPRTSPTRRRRTASRGRRERRSA